MIVTLYKRGNNYNYLNYYIIYLFIFILVTPNSSSCLLDGRFVVGTKQKTSQQTTPSPVLEAMLDTFGVCKSIF